MRVAIVTPYHKEPPEKLLRCHTSVVQQTHACDHLMVADGHPADCVDAWNIRHIVLDKEHADFGCTPRCIGAVAAITLGYDAVGFLDADNWFAPDHVETCVATLSDNASEAAFASRHLISPDGRLLHVEEVDESTQSTADTSCHFVSAKAAFSLPWWGLMPPRVMPACDRFVFGLIKARNLKTAWTGRKTVYYETNYASHFGAAGMSAPADTHDHHVLTPQQLDAAVGGRDTAARLGFAVNTSWASNRKA
jgi:hypothetical protein